MPREYVCRPAGEAVGCDTDNAPSPCSTGFHLIRERLSGSCFTRGREHKNTLTLTSCLLGINYAGKPRECVLQSHGIEKQGPERESRIGEVK